MDPTPIVRKVLEFLVEKQLIASPLDAFDLAKELERTVLQAGGPMAGSSPVSGPFSHPPGPHRRAVELAPTDPNDPFALPPHAQTRQKPAVPIKDSVQPDYIICLEDGERVVLLRRHLKNRYGMTPDQYRLKWGLPPDYPMTAPNFAKFKSEMAYRTDFGQIRRRLATGTTNSPPPGAPEGLAQS